MPDNQYLSIPEEIWLTAWADLEEVIMGGGSSRDIVPKARPDSPRASHWLVSGEAVVFLKAVTRLAYLRAGIEWRGPQTTAIAKFLLNKNFPVVRDESFREGLEIPATNNTEGLHDPRKAPKYEVSRRLSRPDQARFRAELMSIYGVQCAISGCTVVEVLEACHIKSHEAGGPSTSSNGVILRRDLHRLFDLGLIALDPAKLSWRFHDSTRDHYKNLIDNQDRPVLSQGDTRTPALRAHWIASQLCD